jgi:O-acetyl-ADP-ribose deacetylase (regulator of RNase III)
MIRFVRGNLFDSGAQTLVNPVNCRGVMGKGLAKVFKDRWPEMFRQYQEACKKGEVRPGYPFLFKGDDRQILSVPTKDDWKKPSTYEMVEAGLKAIRERYRDWGITSIAMPALGCGLGGLEWSEVRSLIETHLADVSIGIEVYEPQA